MGPEVQRNALFEVGTRFQNDELHFSLAYNRNSRYQNLVAQWAHATKDALIHKINNLPTPKIDPGCPSDVPQARLLQEEVHGRSETHLEKAYACLPLQGYMLASQSTDPSVS